MFEFLRKKRGTVANRPVPHVPGGADSLAKRGAWLGIGHVKAARDAVGSLTALCRTPPLPKHTQNCIRLELAMFCLSRSAELVGPLLAERFPNLTTESLLQIQRVFLDSAWRSVGLFVEEGPGSVDDPYDHCTSADARSALLWERLEKFGVKIALVGLREDLAAFEHRVLYGAALFLLMDCLTVSEAQVAADHESFHQDTGLNPV